MYRVCIATVGAARARLFTYEHSADAEDAHDKLVEHSELVNPARRGRSGELVSSSQLTSSYRDGVSPDGPNDDDHRVHHTALHDVAFARMVMAAFRELIDEQQPQRVIVSADPRMLGKLRAVMAGLLSEDIPRDELSRDLDELTAPQLRDQLASQRVLPPRIPRSVHAVR
jgi:protein required for attachment to host cells